MSDPKKNPYLAHRYEEDGDGDGDFHSHGVTLDGPVADKRRRNGQSGGACAGFERFKTTAAQAIRAEDSANNPFTGVPFSQNYISILKSRRDLPVHAQR